MITSVSKDQSEAFGLLRRPQIPTDLLSEDRWEQYHTGALQQAGLNPAFARRAETPLGNVWLIPGDGWLCVSLAASPDRYSLDGGGLTANMTDQALIGRVLSWTRSRSGVGQMIRGLVPDSTEEVTLIAADGSKTTPRICDNVYGADLGSALARVCIDGKTVLNIGVPESSGLP